MCMLIQMGLLFPVINWFNLPEVSGHVSGTQKADAEEQAASQDSAAKKTATRTTKPDNTEPAKNLYPGNNLDYPDKIK